MTTRTAALIIGLIFIAVGILGFVPNPIVGADEQTVIFHADKVHNMVHIASGVLFVLVALAVPSFVGTFMVIFGLVYLALGILGLVSIGIQGMGQVAGFLHVNGPDNLLHVGLGIFIILAGTVTRKSYTTT